MKLAIKNSGAEFNLLFLEYKNAIETIIKIIESKQIMPTNKKKAFIKFLKQVKGSKDIFSWSLNQLQSLHNIPLKQPQHHRMRGGAPPRGQTYLIFSILSLLFFVFNLMTMYNSTSTNSTSTYVDWQSTNAQLPRGRLPVGTVSNVVYPSFDLENADIETLFRLGWSFDVILEEFFRNRLNN
jgi:hypothetical protein